MLFGLHDLSRGTAFYVNVLFAGGAGGLIVAASVGWMVGRAVTNVWRRAMTAMVALAGAAFVAMLTIVADAAAGSRGLLVLATLCLAMLYLSYRAIMPR